MEMSLDDDIMRIDCGGAIGDRLPIQLEERQILQIIKYANWKVLIERPQIMAANSLQSKY